MILLKISDTVCRELLMSRYNNYGQPQHASNAAPSGSFSTSLINERHDEKASQSGSEDGNYALYAEAHKTEADLEGAPLFNLYPLTTKQTVSEDSNTALTLQTLNADGTPKRPMNAFMIFARRRRPQVSAENQAMRTGEISKILSKEWVAMPPVITDNYRFSFLSYAFGSPRSNFTLNKQSS